MATAGRFRSSADLITETLANLGVLSPGQNQDPEDTAYVQAKLDPVFRMLADLEICYVPDPGNIPGQWFSPLADILAGECATKFGVTPDVFATLVKKGLGEPLGSGAAAMALKQMRRGRPTYEPLRVHYF